MANAQVNNPEHQSTNPLLENVDMAEPISIKQMLAQLDGVFPIDEVVIEGDGPWKTTQLQLNIS